MSVWDDIERRVTMGKVYTFSLRIPEKHIGCWLNHFFAVIEKERLAQSAFEGDTND